LMWPADLSACSSSHLPAIIIQITEDAMRKSWFIRACAVIAAILLAMPGSNALVGAEPATSSDLTLVPNDCVGFISIRVADLLGKLGVTATDTPACLAEMFKACNLGSMDIERITVVYQSTAKDTPLWIVQSVKPLRQKDILGEYFPNSETV